MANAISSRKAEADRIVSVIGLAIAGLFMIGVAVYRNRLLLDPDTAWHIRSGSDIWNSRSFPVSDSYSHTFLGQPWIAKEWLSQLILYVSHGMAGWGGVNFAASLAILLFGGTIYFLLACHIRPLAAAAVTVPALFLSSPVFLARPHIFTMALTLIWGYLLFEAARRQRAPPLPLLLILVLWANLHGGFTLGYLIAFFAFLDFAERTRLKDRRSTALWLIFLALCPAVTLLHPYGYQAALMTLRVAGPNEAIPFISEWQPFNARDYLFHEIGLLIMLAMLLVSGARFTFSRSLFAVVMLYMFFSHFRFCYLFFSLTPVILAPDLATQFPGISAKSWALQPRDPVERAMAARFVPLAGFLASGIAAVLLAILVVLPAVPEPGITASGAIAYAKEHWLTGHVMNGYDFGGALIFNGIPTYIDGRTDQLFLGGFAANDRKTQEPGGGKLFVKALMDYKIEWTLFKPDDPRLTYLDTMENWSRAYADSTAVIHVLKGSRPQ